MDRYRQIYAYTKHTHDISIHYLVLTLCQKLVAGLYTYELYWSL